MTVTLRTVNIYLPILVTNMIYNLQIKIYQRNIKSIATQLPEVYDTDCQQHNKPVPPSPTNNINRPLTPKSDDSRSNCPSKCEFEFKHRGVHIAIRHLKPKVDNMKVLLDQNRSIYIFGLCETFLNDSIDNEQIHINGFKFERKDRLNTVAHPSGKGGGILMYVAEHIDYSRRKEIESTDIESMWIEIEIKNSKSYLICSVYRPPSSNIEWCESFSKEIEKALTLD